MNKQYCKVGTVTPISVEKQIPTVLELRYRNFIEKASKLSPTDTHLVEFFKRKAQQMKKLLEDLA